MAAIPEPRAAGDHRAPRCSRHHVHMVNCPDCCAWHRDQLRNQHDQAAQRQAQREAAAR